jgi:hypothetical protein
MKRLFIAVLSLGIFASAAADEGKQNPLDQFREQTNYHLLMCRLKERLAINTSQLGEESNPVAEIGACIRDAKSQAKRYFPAALKVASKQPAAGKLLKDYYASWLTSLNGVMPSPTERKIDYERRQDDADAKHDAIWNRLEVELGH